MRKDDGMSLSGNKLAGGNPENERVEHDYYATNPKALTMLLEKYILNGKQFLEPCVGEGYLVEELKKHYDNIEVDSLDIVNRGYPNTIVTDFLTYKTDKKYDVIVTNPPYSLAQQFIEKSMSLLSDNGQIAMFLKIQFLEGGKRKNFYEKFPPKYIYVFRNRMATWNNGQEINPETGKKWSTTMCHAWYIWEKGSKSEPIIRWL